MKLKLIHKLLIAMFTCAALVLVLFTLVTRASIGSGFMDFLQHQEKNQVELLVPGLADWYREHGSWDEMASNPREFYELVFDALVQGSDTQGGLGPEPGRLALRGEGRGPRFPRNSGGQGPRGQGPGEPGSGDQGLGEARPGGQRLGPGGQGLGPGGQRGGPGGRGSLPQRIFLLNEDMTPVIGEIPPETDRDKLLPINVNGLNAGWLGVAVIASFKLPEEEAFIAQLRNNLLIGLGLGLLVAALLAWLLARHLSRPVNTIAEGVRRLAAGDFNVQLDTPGNDELARLGDDVNRLASALSEHETARKRWMSDIAHELRTPLSIISGELEAMNDGVRPLDKEQLASVREEVRHLGVLVDDLHNLALTDSGALAYKMQRVDLEELVQMTVDSFHGQAADNDLKLSYESPGKAVHVQGDDQRLRQLMANLLENAVRYTDAGGFISVTLTTDNRIACLTINDSTPGASAEECERLFERLYRMESSRNRHFGGSGLGLAICRNIVHAHGGSIKAEPGSDGGLLITTTLPLVQ